MKARIRVLLTTLMLLLIPAGSLADGTVVVRDPSGKIIEKRTTRGDRTEVRSPTGKLIRVEIRKNDRVEIRDPSGKLLRTEKGGR
jgi:hypothetical protein